MNLQVDKWGSAGEKIVCVHGSLSAGEAAFSEQRPLADRWQLVVPYRRGYGDNPPIEQVDVNVDAEDVIELIGGAHFHGTRNTNCVFENNIFSTVIRVALDGFFDHIMLSRLQ